MLGCPPPHTGADNLTPAQRFILRYIAGHRDQDDEVPATEIYAAGELAAYEKADLSKARCKIRHRVRTRKGGMKDGWIWSLTDDPDNEPLLAAEPPVKVMKVMKPQFRGYGDDLVTTCALTTFITFITADPGHPTWCIAYLDRRCLNCWCGESRELERND